MKPPAPFTKAIVRLLPLLAIIACGSDEHDTASPDDGGSNVGEQVTPSPLATVDGGTAGENSQAPSGIVVLNSDYQSSSVSFLDREGNLLKDGCLDSGSKAQGLSLTLSGDLALPTRSPMGGDVVLIDRQNSVLTWVNPNTCAVTRQLSVGTGFAANPHDYVWLSQGKAYVPRYGENALATPTPTDFDEGSDLLILDPTLPKILGRIDLKRFAPAGTSLLPMADRALLAEGKVYVSLNVISADWKNYGEGRIVIVDPAIDQVVGILDIPEVRNCGAMNFLSDEKKLFIACAGDTSAGPQQAKTSAIVVVDLSTTPPTVVSTFDSTIVAGLPFSNWAVAALDSNTVLGVTEGSFSSTPPDQLWALSRGGGQAVNVFASAEAFTLGAILVDPANRRFLLADGTSKTLALLRVFTTDGGTITPAGTINANPTLKLPARALAWY